MNTSTDTRSPERTAASIAGLREAAELLDQHPDLPEVYVTAGGWGYTDVTWQLLIRRTNAAEQRAAAQQIVRAIGGKWDKRELGDTFMFTQDHGVLQLRISVEREAVCDRVVTGTETVTIPAVEAKPEQVIEREVVEWRCEPLLTKVVAS